MAQIISMTLRRSSTASGEIAWIYEVVRDDNYKAVETTDTESIAETIEQLISFADQVKTKEQKELEAVEKQKQAMLDFVTENTTEAQKLEMVEAFDEWKVDTVYKVADYRKHHGVLYVCKKDHTSDYQLMPELATAYWRKAVAEVPRYPLYDHETTYQINDRVEFGRHIWCSLVKQQGESPYSSPQTWEDEGVVNG